MSDGPAGGGLATLSEVKATRNEFLIRPFLGWLSVHHWRAGDWHLATAYALTFGLLGAD